MFVRSTSTKEDEGASFETGGFYPTLEWMDERVGRWVGAGSVEGRVGHAWRHGTNWMLGRQGVRAREGGGEEGNVQTAKSLPLLLLSSMPALGRALNHSDIRFKTRSFRLWQLIELPLANSYKRLSLNRAITHPNQYTGQGFVGHRACQV